jgi:threonylcarbamoyladenosine tRNA methylthiotransferase MtaB
MPDTALPGQGLTVAFFTLGCKLNQYESDALAAEFRGHGFTVVENQDGADVFVVNSCTVTDRASRKSRNLGNRAERQLGRARLVVLTGCHSELDTTAHRDGVLVVGNRRKHDICRLVLERLAVPHMSVDPSGGANDPFGFNPPASGFHTRATVKVQDGCDSFCSYCIIPAVRGPGTSRPLADILAEVRRLAAAGFREIVLTGVNMARWQAPPPPTGGGAAAGPGFTGLVRAILDLELPAGQEFRLRLSSLEPEGLGDDFPGLFRHPRLCRSLHLCLQSGSPTVLERMRRSYGLADYRHLVAGLRAADPDFCLSTDLITGFPGETEEDFAASQAALGEFGFLHVHVFPFSRRHGTAADAMDGQVPQRVRDGRADQVRLGDDSRRGHWLARFAGRDLSLLVESIALPGAGAERFLLCGQSEYGFTLRLSLDHRELEQLAAILPTRVERPPPPGIAAVLERAKPGLRPVLAALWNRVLPVRTTGGTPDPDGNLPCRPAGTLS